MQTLIPIRRPMTDCTRELAVVAVRTARQHLTGGTCDAALNFRHTSWCLTGEVLRGASGDRACGQSRRFVARSESSQASLGAQRRGHSGLVQRT